MYAVLESTYKKRVYLSCTICLIHLQHEPDDQTLAWNATYHLI